MNLQKLKQQKSIQELLEFGIINIDKPSGMTSFDVVDRIRRILKLRKASHFGTLDPKVTGVLPIALNRACKLTGFFIGEDKEYIGKMRIHEDIALEKIKDMIKRKFLGKIIQLPPVKSRVKRQEREREVMKFELLEKNGQNITFHAEVQGGTYIRKLIHDLGQALGINAHMLELRRIRAGIFLEKDSIKLEKFEEICKDEKELRKVIMPAEIISKVYPIVQIKEDNLKQIFTGKPIYKSDLIKDEKFKKEQIICVFNKDKFVGMYKVINETDIFAKAKFVLQPLL